MPQTSPPQHDATESTVKPNETTVPLLPCADPDETLAFYRALGFEVTYEMRKPYVYLVVEYSGFALHFGRAPKNHDPATEDGGGCLVLVDAVAPYHAAFTAAMRKTYGKVLASGRPRITRYRPGASRFTVVDPSGNGIIFIQRDEPEELEYGGDKTLPPLARALDNARIFREFKNDDRAAFRAVKSALRRHGAQAAPVDRALAVATLVELSIALDERDGVKPLVRDLEQLLPQLTEPERQRVTQEFRLADRLDEWIAAAEPVGDEADPAD
ncbi:glyoxalase [Yinghuangia soli]|uniref:Glyoxalase n=1 Tax=Yinghuangia soli TaxID=2908204 RepID=A0AA41TY25_9ACTN|nr:glyoxalase [Yinghuangia soli]MCF2525705.1 glyoxalase [Yinghuangia soli]